MFKFKTIATIGIAAMVALSPIRISQALADDTIPAMVYNDLTELFARRSYANNKPVNLLYTGGRIQPELLHFYDTQYGTHVWRVTYSYKGYTFAHNHINRSPWNCNGSKLGLISNRYFPPHWSPDPAAGAPGDPHVYMMDTTGDNFSELNCQNLPSHSAGGTRFRHYAWDRNNPDYAYFSDIDGLYRLDIRTPGIFEKVADLPNTERKKRIYAQPSESNIVMVIDDLANGYVSPMFYFVDLNKPMGDPGQVTSYPIAFDLDFPSDHNKLKENSFHDIYFTRRADNSFSFNYGPAAGLGEYIFYIAPFNGDKGNITVWYDNRGTGGAPYHSHPAWGPGGAHTSYFGERYPYGSNNWGWHVADDAARQPITRLALHPISGGHIAWDGYDPNYLFAAVTINNERKIISARVDGPQDNYVPFVNPYSGLNDDADGYQTSPRPAQSPDATKVFYHSSMSESTDAYIDSYIAVARYPQPPGNVRLHDSSQARIIWDKPEFGREIKKYHLYRSDGDALHFAERADIPVQSLEYIDTALIEGVPYYYAATSEEWSGLESDRLSNIIQVVYSSGAYSFLIHESQGRHGFDTQAPAQVTGVDYSQVSLGVYQVNWDPSTAGDIWYYNIYYSIEGNPPPTQHRLISSVPGSGHNYIDWQARQDEPAYYGITAVDRQGNESAIAYRGSGIPGDVNGNGRIDIVDLLIVARAFGSTPVSSNWDIRADLDGNSLINIADLVSVARNYGRQ